MRTNVLHHGYQWRRPRNHMDARTCPYCAATVNGQDQRGHLQYHQDLWDKLQGIEEMLDELAKRTGMAEEEVDVPARWTAVTEGGFRAIDGPGGDPGE